MSTNGYDSLIAGFTQALEDNSRIIGDALQVLTTKKLSESHKKELARIKKELKKIDENLSIIE